jgi:hypothetical protein
MTLPECSSLWASSYLVLFGKFRSARGRALPGEERVPIADDGSVGLRSLGKDRLADRARLAKTGVNLRVLRPGASFISNQYFVERIWRPSFRAEYYAHLRMLVEENLPAPDQLECASPAPIPGCGSKTETATNSAGL